MCGGLVGKRRLHACKVPSLMLWRTRAPLPQPPGFHVSLVKHGAYPVCQCKRCVVRQLPVSCFLWGAERMWVVDEHLGFGEDGAAVIVSDIAGCGTSYKGLPFTLV